MKKQENQAENCVYCGCMCFCLLCCGCGSFYFNKVVELVGGGSNIDGATPSSFIDDLNFQLLNNKFTFNNSHFLLLAKTMCDKDIVDMVSCYYYFLLGL